MVQPRRFQRLKTQVRKLRLPLLGLFVLLLGLIFSTLDLYFQQDRAARLQSESLLYEQTQSNAALLLTALGRQMDAVQTAAAALSAFSDLQGVTARTTLRSYLGESELVSLWVTDRNGLGQDPSGNVQDFSGVEVVNKALLGQAADQPAWRATRISGSTPIPIPTPPRAACAAPWRRAKRACFTTVPPTAAGSPPVTSASASATGICFRTYPRAL